MSLRPHNFLLCIINVLDGMEDLYCMSFLLDAFNADEKGNPPLPFSPTVGTLQTRESKLQS